MQKLDLEKIVCNIEALKTEYTSVLASFSCKKIKDEIRFISNFRKKIYSLDVEEYKKNMIWEFLNGDIDKIDNLK